MRRKLTVAVLAAALSSFGILGMATPASATCTEVPGAEDAGCIERVVCAVGSKVGGNCVE